MTPVETYLISLPRSHERRARMHAQLTAMGLPYRHMPGVDGKAEWSRLVESVDTKAFIRNVGRPVLQGEIGAYHAHLVAWKAFLSGGGEVALILEDDVIFHDGFMKSIDIAIKNIDSWDFLKLNKIRAKLPIRQKNLGAWQLNAYLGPATGLGAYLITRALAQRLLPTMLPITRPIDHELDRIHIHDLRHFGIEPFPSHVDDGHESTITGTGFSAVEKFPWYRRLPMFALRWRTSWGKFFYLLRKKRLF